MYGKESGSRRHFALAAAFALIFFLSGTAFAAPVLKKGAEGPDVRALQQSLGALGYEVEINGVFGNATYRAVLAFQRDAKLKVSGTVDGPTWRALKKRAKLKKPSGAAEPLAPAAPKAPESAPFLPRAKAEAVIRTARKYMGTRYQFGGTTPKGFDCSGFLQYVFKENGYSIARTADLQYKLGKAVKKRAELVPGDLVFFSTYEKGASHCGIYLGKNQFIHVSSSKGVRVDSLDDAYWKPRWYGGKHIVKE